MKPWMMAALAAAALAGAPAPAFSQATPAASEAYNRSLEVWLVDISRWMGPAQALAGRSTDLLAAVTEGAEQVLELDTRSKRAAASRWAAQWVPARRAELAALRLDAAALPDAPPLAGALLSDPRMVAKTGHVAGMNDTVQAMVDSNIRSTDRLLNEIEKTANGDDEAGRSLLGASFTAIIASLRSENEFMAMSSAFSSETQPQTSLVSAMISTNHGVIALFEYLTELTRGEKPDAEAYAARMSQHALAVRSAANETRQRTQVTIDALRADPSLKGSVLMSRLEPAVLLYNDSAAVELELADKLKTMADHIARGTAASPEFQQASDAFDPLVTKRLEIDKRRKALLAGDG